MLACQNSPDSWFSDDPAELNEVKSLCTGCPLIDGCADWGMRHELWGVWGGLTPKDRNRLRREIGMVPAEPLTGYSHKRRRAS